MEKYRKKTDTEMVGSGHLLPGGTSYLPAKEWKLIKDAMNSGIDSMLKRVLKNFLERRKSMDKHYRQGDVLFIKIDELPPLEFETRKDKVVLKGEVTGHAHKLEGKAKILEVAERIANAPFGGPRMTWNGNTLTAHLETTRLDTLPAAPNSQVIGYAVVDAPAELTHEEHKPITIPAGVYQIRRQKEYDEKEIRFVED